MVNIHPLHDYPAGEALASAIDPLFRVKVDGQLFEPSGSVILFTSVWFAARYLESSSGFSPDEIEMLPFEIGAGIPSAIVDPCSLCDWRLDAHDSRSLAQALAERRLRIGQVKDRVRALVDSSDFETAFDLSRVAAGHLSPGDPEIHFYCGLCALKLGNKQALDLARQNLSLIDPSWLAQLEKASI